MPAQASNKRKLSTGGEEQERPSTRGQRTLERAMDEEDYDTIRLQSLELPCLIEVASPWKHHQPQNRMSSDLQHKLTSQLQPATVSITLTLEPPGFASAARGDALDGSTVHYGNLAKAIRSRLSNFSNEQARENRNVSLFEAFTEVEDCISELNRVHGPDGVGFGPMAKAIWELSLPKAAMYAREVKLGGMRKWTSTDEAYWVEHCDIQISCLVGVNDYERAAKQPLIANVRCEWYEHEGLQDVVEALLQVEKMLMDIVEETSFETLESLVTHAAVELKRRMMYEWIPGGRLRLRLAKPRAVVLAEAPSVEVTRCIPTQEESDEDDESEDE